MSNSPIENARSYIYSTVFEPALSNLQLSDKVKAKVKHSRFWFDKFQRVGDLLVYLKRFNASNADSTYVELKNLKLKTFEDVVDDFEDKFSLWANDCTRASDFVIGNAYNVYQILIFARSYDTRSGGMFVLESGGKPSAVIIKATLDGGDYPNKWITKPTNLKYFLKSINGDFGEHFKTNAAIIENPSIPIHTFVRLTNNNSFIYYGVFNKNSDKDKKNPYCESDGSKWFDLIRVNQQPNDVLVESNFISNEFDKEVQEALQSSRDNRLVRLSKAPKKPAQIRVRSLVYVRNPDVVAEVLYRAKDTCESCLSPAPFIKKLDSTPYLEVHHRVPLAQDGDDTVENAIAICPNCHRKFHFG